MNDSGDGLVATPAEWQLIRATRSFAAFSPLLPLGTLAGCAAVGAALWPVAPRAVLAGWLGVGLALAGALAGVACALRSRRGGATAHEARARRRSIVLGSLAAGLFWGGTPLVLAPFVSPLHQSLLALVLAAVLATWLPMLALERLTVLTLAAPASLPMALLLLIPPTAAPLATMGSFFLLLPAACLLVADVVKRVLDAELATHRELYHRATHDALVGLANRAEFERRLAAVEAAPAGPFAVVLIDLDHFKQVNDTAGHAAGDRVLRAVGAILRAEKRKSDLAARLGGDEFAILMALCNDHEALRVAAAVRRRIAALFVEHGGARLRVTASIGIACGSGGDGVLEAADRACYAAKRGGRNRICFAPRAAAADRGPTLAAAAESAQARPASGARLHRAIEVVPGMPAA